MGGAHTHGGEGLAEVDLVASDGLRRGLTALVLVIAVAALAGLVLLWPNHRALDAARPDDPYAGVTFVSGQVRSVTRAVCAGGTTEDRLPDGTVPATVACVDASVAIATRPDGRSGPVKINLPPQAVRAGLGVGDEVRLSYYPAAAGTPATYAFSDYDRRLPLALLAVGFVLVVLAVARWKGLAALVGLVVAFPTITLFMLPALRAGGNPVLVGLVGATLIMTVVLYLTHGVSTRTTVALLGTLTGLLVAAGLATWMSHAAHLDGLGTEQAYQVSRLTTGGGLNGLVLCGVIIASLGVLNDVTIAQVASIWELRAHAPHLGVRGLFTSGMRIGRDHLASTVYTIAFASAGAALPTLVLINLYQQPLVDVLNGGAMAEEIVRTLVASIGLVLAIPLTTVIAALVATSLRAAPERGARGHRHDVDLAGERV